MADFQYVLLEWYLENKRELPWRKTKDPYKIWLSEIILQQTRVNQGIDYYVRFIERFPTISDLAQAQEQEVLAMWQGLGYYSRARNLHSTARYIFYDLHGNFPGTYNELITLKGVGPYTAAAIASFAFGERRGVLDGNVFRVLSRLFDIKTPINSSNGQKEFSSLAQHLVNKKDPGTHNQALMEFGALICLPKNPACGACPFQVECVSLKRGNVNKLPVKTKKLKKKERFFLYKVFVNYDKNEVFLRKRKSKDIWQNLYDFHLTELVDRKEFDKKSKEYERKYKLVKNKHLLSHQTIYAGFVEVPISKKEKAHKDLLPVKFDELRSFPLPTLIKNYLDANVLRFNKLILP